MRPRPHWFRGTNYLPATTVGLSNALSLIPWFRAPQPGYYSHEHARDEIKEIARAGFNSIRLITASFTGWLLDRSGYMAALEDLAGHCARNGIAITYVLWSSTCSNQACFEPDFLALNWNKPPAELWREVRRLEDLSRGIVFPPGEPGQYVKIPEPGPTLSGTWPNVEEELWHKVLEYVRDVGRFFATHNTGRAAYGSYDLYNEPDAVDSTRWSGTRHLIADTWRVLEEEHHDNLHVEYTIGLADATWVAAWHEAMASRIRQSYLSYHTDLPRIHRNLERVGALAHELDLPQVVSEFWHLLPAQGQRNQMRRLVDAILAVNAGGQMWGYLQSNVFFDGDPVDGIVVPRLPASLTAPITFDVEIPVDHAAVRYWTSRPFFDRTTGGGVGSAET